MNNQMVTRVTVEPSVPVDPTQLTERIALFDTNGAPIKLNPPVEAAVITPLTDAATIAVDASKGKYFTVTLGGNRTLGVPSNPTDGQHITFEVKQDGTGTHTLAYASGAGGYSFGAGSAPTVTATANLTSLVEFSYSARVGKWLYRNSVLGF